MTHVLDLISAQLDGELAPAEERAVTAHLAECETCRAESAGIAAVRDAVRSLPVLDPPVVVLARRRPRRWITAAASVAAGALAIGLAVAPGRPASPFDLDTIAGQHTIRQGVDPAISTVRGPGMGP